MAVTYDQLQMWKPEELDAAADDLNTARKKLLDQQDEMDAGKVPDTWVGEAATRAENRHRALVESLNDIASPLGQVIMSLDEASAVIKKAKSSAHGAYQSATEKGWKVSTGSPVTITAGDAETKDGDEATMKELAQTIQDALTDAERAENDLVNVLNRATSNAYDGGTGTIEQATLPDELRGLSDDELTKKLLDNPELMDDSWEVLPPEVQAQIGDYTAKKLEDLDDIDSVAERKEAEKWFSILGKHSDDRDFGEAVIDRLGPQGVNNVIHQMTGWTRTQITYPDYENPPVSIGDETMALQKLQREGAGNLAALLGSASRGGWIDNADYAEKIGQDSTAAAILLHAAEGRNVELGADFTHKLGTQLLETENGDPLRYSQINYGLSFGGESFMDENGDPLRQFVKVADNGIGSAQAVMGDENMAKYLMHDRLTASHMADDMDSVVRAATVDAAMEPGETGKKAAEIASWTIDYAASEDLDEAYDEELGGIIGTYIADTYAAIDNGAYPLPEGQEIPPFHANFNKDDLSSVLKDVGNNETATSIIGTQSGKLTQLMFDQGALASLDGRVAGAGEFHPDTPGDPLIDKIGSAAGLRGYLEDQLAEGMLEGSEGDEEARRKTAELFTLPLDLIPVDKLGPVGGLAGGYLLDGIKEQVIDGYVGDPSKSAAIEGNNNYESARRATELQALYAIARAESDVPPAGHADPEVRTGADGVSRFKTEGWPTDPAGVPIPPGKLTPEQMATVLSNHQHDPGINAAVTNTVKTSWDNYQVAAGVRSE
ncbi:hypothetical protein ACFVJS_03240 [Nocardioides sp. NPDC057772]|uniref:WXG100 family type VII secretion target n=1 Tax=Nocardioides sp. NPDC057772 TaxID=3346245 RepID=UPI00367073AE